MLRTIVAATIGLIPLLPDIIHATGIDETLPWVAATLSTAAAITRVLALPGVERWLQDNAPWLSAAGGYHGLHRKESNENNHYGDAAGHSKPNHE